MFYFERVSSFDKWYEEEFIPEIDGEIQICVHHEKSLEIDNRRWERFRKKVQIESSRRRLERLITSNEYRGVHRGDKKFRLEALRARAGRSK